MIPMRIITKKVLKTEVLHFGFFICISLCLLSCNTKRITAEEIVLKSIEAHGGIEVWNQLKHLEFDKTTILYTKEGIVEKEIEQHQMFLLKPSLEGALLSKIPKQDELYYHGNAFSRVINDSVYMVADLSELEAVKNAFFAAHYVVSQPFKLQDDTVILDYIGIEKLDYKNVYVLDVSYSSDSENSDQWTYYFDVETYQLVANKVKHNNNVSLIKNLSFNTETGLTFNAHRLSYMLLDKDNTFLRAEYFYTNFKAQFE
jgi:hypothetical protein